jgi:molybdopterin-guanine dinucleotide biosynthesis protein A
MVGPFRADIGYTMRGDGKVQPGARWISGLIIAGGRSSRMGRDKALLPVGGLPLIAVLLARMAPHCGRIIIAAGDERRAREYRAAIAPALEGGAIAERRVAFALDRYAGCGPLAGLHAGLSELQTGWALVTGSDMPHVSASLLARMRAAAAAAGAAAAVVHAPGQPFHALYRAGLAREVAERLERGDRRLMALLERPDAVVVAPETDEEREAFVNLNTPEAYEAYAARHGAHAARIRET